MLVFNLTDRPIAYRNRTIPPEGQFDFKDMDFVPDRDKALEKSKILSFGSRPSWWRSSKPAALTVAQVEAATPKTASLEVASFSTEVQLEERVELGYSKKKNRY